MNMKEVCTYKGVSPKTIREAVRRGELNPMVEYIPRKTWIFDPQELDQWDKKAYQRAVQKKVWENADERRNQLVKRSRERIGIRRDGSTDLLDRSRIQINDDDYQKVLKFGRCWFISKRKNASYAACDVEGKRVYLHRWLLKPTLGKHVDHINGDGLDNRRSNLRIVTPTENALNRSKPTNATSGYRGVRRSGDLWHAYFNHRNRQISIGTYPTAELAACARDYHIIDGGHETAKLNFVDPPHIRQEVFASRSFLKESDHPGIRFKNNGWETNVRINGRRKYVGRFQTLAEALEAQRELLFTNTDRIG